MRNSLNHIVRRSVKLKELNPISRRSPLFASTYQHQLANSYFQQGLRDTHSKGRRRRPEVCTLCSCAIISPLMRNYLLRRSYASEAIRTIDTTPCDQYPRAKQ